MAYQQTALNGEPIQGVTIDDYVLKVLGITSLPNGLIGFDVTTGLARVKPSREGKETYIRIGKLLNKLGRPTKEQTEVGANARKLSLAMKADLKITTTPQEVVDVYARGPQSCMKDCNAVEVYCTEDVAVAYIEIDNSVIARAVVCINKDYGLSYSRIYGVKDPLEHLLQEAGYECNNGFLENCKLRKVEDDYGIIMPYIDTSCYVRDDGDYMIIDAHGDLPCTSTDGYIQRYFCDDCGEQVNGEDDLYYSDYLNLNMCKDCFEDCHILIDGEWYHTEDTDKVIETEDDGYMLCDEVAYVDYRREHHPIEKCIYNNYTEEFLLREDIE